MGEQLFKIGDKIDSIWGEGAVVAIKKEGAEYPVMVKIFSQRGVQNLSKCGFACREDKYPSIWHKRTGTPPSVGERPKWIPTKPTWCWVDGQITLIMRSVHKGYVDAIGN